MKLWTPSHEWISVIGTIGTVGITQHAKKELGDIVHVELPSIGRKVDKGDQVCILESTKSAVDVYAPVSGKIIAVNAALKTSIHLINSSAEQDGWLYQIELTRLEELDELLSQTDYDHLISCCIQ
jgi:glycine cleavage system H protein